MEGCRVGAGCSTYGKLRCGLCERHYKAFKLYGDPLVRKSNKGLTPEQRFWLKVDKTDTCWLWTAKVSATTGYAFLSVGGKSVLAHRFSYELHYGPIPDGLVLDHLCRTRACVRPDHLEAVTQAENIRRGAGLAAANAAKTHCPQGHPYDEANTLWTAPTHRMCRTCGRDSMRRRRAAKKTTKKP